MVRVPLSLQQQQQQQVRHFLPWKSITCYGLPMPVQSPFHEHVDGRVSPYDGGNAIA